MAGFSGIGRPGALCRLAAKLQVAPLSRGRKNIRPKFCPQSAPTQTRLETSPQSMDADNHGERKDGNFRTKFQIIRSETRNNDAWRATADEYEHYEYALAL